jgi:intracellular sulfur oxidation DsrE/DsrF family protein
MMERRSFLSRFSVVAAALGLSRPAHAAPAAGAFDPSRHPQDDWFDQLPGKHRVVFDTWSADKFDDAIRFANNIFRGNKDGYDLTEKDLAVIIIARHRTAPFAYNDAMWAKYGKAFSERMEFVDPKTKEAPTKNPYGTQLAALVKQGVHLGICNLTTKSYAQRLGELTGKPADEVYNEITSNTVGNGHFVPAGVVGATRAQEHGYALVSIG